MSIGVNSSILRNTAGYFSGNASVIPALLLNFLALRLVLSALQDNYLSSSGILVLFSWACFNLVIFGWQFVGAARLLAKLSREKADPASIYLGWAIVTGALAVSLLQAIDLMTLKSPGREEILMQNYSAPELILSDDRKSAHIDGDLDYRQNTGLQRAILENPGLETVILNSDGGLVYAARALARNIIEAKLNTKVTGRCNSSCTLVFAAGEKRSIGSDGKLGFHQYALASKFHNNTLDFRAEERRDKAFLLARGISPDFVDRIFLAPHNDMWFPTRHELVEFGVIDP